MAYQCLDCSYKAESGFPGGCCPACDSRNIKKSGSTKLKDDVKEPKTKIELAVLVLFWAVLIYGVWDRYLK